MQAKKIRLGAPVESLALESGLPLDAVIAGEGVIGEHAAWNFIAQSSAYLGCEHFGYLTALDHPVDRNGGLGDMAIARAGTLFDILDTFTRDVVRQSDNTDYKLVEENGETWFTRRIPLKHEAAWITDQPAFRMVFRLR